MSHEFRPVLDTCKELYDEVQKEEQNGKDVKNNCMNRFVEGITVSLCEAFGAQQVQNIVLDTISNICLSKVGLNNLQPSDNQQINEIDHGLSTLQSQIMQWYSTTFCHLNATKEQMERQQDNLVSQKIDWSDYHSKIQVDVRNMQDRKISLQE